MHETSARSNPVNASRSCQIWKRAGRQDDSQQLARKLSKKPLGSVRSACSKISRFLHRLAIALQKAPRELAHLACPRSWAAGATTKLLRRLREGAGLNANHFGRSCQTNMTHPD